VEPGDATAAAAATDAGIAFGSAHANGYAIRIDIDPAALGSLDESGTTQFRLAFSGMPSGSGTDRVVFADGDASSPVTAPLPVLSDAMGTAAPFLDVTYEIPLAVGDAQPRHGEAILDAPGPNPFVRTTTVRFSLPHPGPVDLAIYDVAGRRVTTLIGGSMPAGSHLAPWDGRDRYGNPAAAGVYWVRLLWESRVRSQRLIRLQP
jgi:hypothetical protein